MSRRILVFFSSRLNSIYLELVHSPENTMAMCYNKHLFVENLLKNHPLCFMLQSAPSHDPDSLQRKGKKQTPFPSYPNMPSIPGYCYIDNRLSLLVIKHHP